MKDPPKDPTRWEEFQANNFPPHYAEAVRKIKMKKLIEKLNNENNEIKKKKKP